MSRSRLALIRKNILTRLIIDAPRIDIALFIGGVIAADGHNTSEINQCIRLAINEFVSLQTILVSCECCCSKENWFLSYADCFEHLCMHLMAFV